jgi:hypothetical protein
MRANASKPKTMTYEHMVKKEAPLKGKLERERLDPLIAAERKKGGEKRVADPEIGSDALNRGSRCETRFPLCASASLR